MLKSLDIITHIFNYIPHKQYKINKLYQKYYENYIKKKVKIIIRFFKKIRYLRKLCKYEYIFKDNRNFTKNTIVKFIMLYYCYDRDCGLPEIMVGSYNLNCNLLNIMNNIYDRNIYDIYKFMKQNEISHEVLVDCWFPLIDL
tara:strand:- start:173 stop:598 length:426 start_codon:yes stop_codon:yes gene_type:complete